MVVELDVVEVVFVVVVVVRISSSGVTSVGRNGGGSVGNSCDGASVG